MLADEGGHPVELRAPEAAALVKADGVEPELGQILVAPHADVRRFGPVTGVKKNRYGPRRSTVGMPNDAMARGRRQWPYSETLPAGAEVGPPSESASPPNAQVKLRTNETRASAKRSRSSDRSPASTTVRRRRAVSGCIHRR